jgi:cytochrome c-type biogenesis protein CcmF
MLAELAQLALSLSLVLALLLGILPQWGAYRRDARLMWAASPLAYGQFALILFAFLALMASFVQFDYSVLNVAKHSNQEQPLAYRLAATWGSHEGSILLWALVMAGWTALFAARRRALPLVLSARALSILGLVNVGILLFVLFTSNPFDRSFPVPKTGVELNPLLQDPGMVFHPPMLYLGYVGFSVAFALAIAALIEGNLDAAWARYSRPWTVAAWCFLTLGICLGSFWAYYELGWGGWWFWDPVENASFMPWITGTALMHSLVSTEKRGQLKSWTLLLAIITFSLSLLGTFLVRSGIITSVHAFATDPTRGVFILAFLLTVIGLSLVLYAFRAPKIAAQTVSSPVGLLSRDSLLFANTLLLLLAMLVVLLGTLYPLYLDVTNQGKVSVGLPWFEIMFPVAMVPLALLLGLASLSQWRETPVKKLLRQTAPIAAFALALALVIPFLLGQSSPLKSLGLFLTAWITCTVLLSTYLKVKASVAASSIAASFWSMQVAHLGVAVFIFGVTMVKGFEQEVDASLSVGQSVSAGQYSVRFAEEKPSKGPNYDGLALRFELTQNGKAVGDISPEKRFYRGSKQSMTEGGIDRSLLRDVYISIGNQQDNGSWQVRLAVKPFVNWIWLGCVLMALGGVVGLFDRRYARARQSLSLPAGVTA